MVLNKKLWDEKKGETQANIIVWIGVLIAVGIVVMWLMGNMHPLHLDLETVNGDLEALQSHVNAACNADYYKYKWNPKTLTGYLLINDSRLCIDNDFDKCRLAMCHVAEDINISFTEVAYIVIEKKKGEDFTFDTER